VNLPEAILLGAVQGITEFLPISSSAHLIIVPHLFRIDEAGVNTLTFDVMLHVGTLLAVLLLYGGKFWGIVREWVDSVRGGRLFEPMLTKIVVATIPAAVAGVLFKGFIEAYLRTPVVIVGTLVAVSILMLVVERLSTAKREITYGVALLIGIAQAVALVPGISRSGITIVTAILVGLRREEAVDFSFLLSIPIIAGTALFEARHLSFHGEAMALYLAGIGSAFVFGALALGFLIRYLKRHTLDLFAFYRIGLALLLLFLLP
jgi:undecaprenyl-diphosphatase